MFYVVVCVRQFAVFDVSGPSVLGINLIVQVFIVPLDRFCLRVHSSG